MTERGIGAMRWVCVFVYALIGWQLRTGGTTAGELVAMFVMGWVLFVVIVTMGWVAAAGRRQW